MACPYFLPERRIGAGGWNPPPRMPLGDTWTGLCMAPPVGPFEPREDTLRELCNYGYAKGRCPHFPAQCDRDAVRFSVVSAVESQQQKIVYVYEKDGAPVAHGEFGGGTEDEILSAQGRAFLDCHRAAS